MYTQTIWAGLWKSSIPRTSYSSTTPQFFTSQKGSSSIPTHQYMKQMQWKPILTSQHQPLNLPILRGPFSSNPSSHNFPKFAKHLDQHPLTPLTHPAISHVFPHSSLRPTSFSTSSCWYNHLEPNETTWPPRICRKMSKSYARNSSSQWFVSKKKRGFLPARFSFKFLEFHQLWGWNIFSFYKSYIQL